MSYAAAIGSLANDTIVISRRAQAARVAGREQPPASVTTIPARASVQTPTGKDLQRLAEGRLVGDVRVVFTRMALLVGGPGTGFLPDFVSFEGLVYEVEHVEHWKSFGANYYRAVVRATSSA